MSDAAAAVRARAQSAWGELDAQPLVEVPRAPMPLAGAPSVAAPAPTPQAGADSAKDFLMQQMAGGATSTAAPQLTDGLKAPAGNSKPITDIRELHGARLNQNLQARAKMVGPPVTPPVGLKHNAREARMRTLQADVDKLSPAQRQEITPETRSALQALGLRF